MGRISTCHFVNQLALDKHLAAQGLDASSPPKLWYVWKVGEPEPVPKYRTRVDSTGRWWYEPIIINERV